MGERGGGARFTRFTHLEVGTPGGHREDPARQRGGGLRARPKAPRMRCAESTRLSARKRVRAVVKRFPKRMKRRARESRGQISATISPPNATMGVLHSSSPESIRKRARVRVGNEAPAYDIFIYTYCEERAAFLLAALTLSPFAGSSREWACLS